ncbi:MAG TPA: Zn-ribbon domain-containing OB-fold protein [Microthrixaceae bacterium]|nr:Zn-ribbon domain-containing OB-fold protein [Microthrixaceae bacterium]
MSGTPFRVLPELTEENRHFWTSGAEGVLRFLRCRGCGYWLHPPVPRCPSCGGRDVAPEAVSGRGTVFSCTVNHQPWDGSAEPWVVALVELPEQEGLRLTTNVVGVAPDEVHIGMPVEVTFEQHDDVWVPLFAPVAEGRGTAG